MALLVAQKLAFVAQIDGAQIAFQHAVALNDDRRVAAFLMNGADGLVAVAFNTIEGICGNHGFDGHFIHRQGAGFIRTDDRHGPERFNGGQLANNGPLPRHRLHAERKNNGDNRRQAFRYGGNRQANQREHQLAERHIAQHQAEDKQRGHHGEDQHKDGFTELVHLHQQRRAVFLNAGHHLVNVPQLGIRTRGDRHADAAAHADGGAGKQQVGAIAQRKLAFERVGMLVHHGGFTRQDSLFNPQVMGFDNA